MNSPKKSKITKEKLEHLKRNAVDLPGLIEYAHAVGGFSVVPTKEGAIKKQAITAMQEQTEDKLGIIYEQMRVLAKQAKQIQDRVLVSEKIYQAKFKFEPVIGSSYYLYEKEDETFGLSLVSPEEWGKSSPLGVAVAKVKLLADHTWKIEEKYLADFEGNLDE